MLKDKIEAIVNEWGEARKGRLDYDDLNRFAWSVVEAVREYDMSVVNPASAMFRGGEGGRFTSDQKVKVKDGEV